MHNALNRAANATMFKEWLEQQDRTRPLRDPYHNYVRHALALSGVDAVAYVQGQTLIINENFTVDVAPWAAVFTAELPRIQPRTIPNLLQALHRAVLITGGTPP